MKPVQSENVTMFNWHSQDRGSAHKEAPSYLRDHGLCFHLFSLPPVNETFFFPLRKYTCKHKRLSGVSVSTYLP